MTAADPVAAANLVVLPPAVVAELTPSIDSGRPFLSSTRQLGAPRSPAWGDYAATVRAEDLAGSLRGVEFAAHLDEPCLEVGMVAHVFCKSVKNRPRTGAKRIHRRAVAAALLDAISHHDCPELQFDSAPVHRVPSSFGGRRLRKARAGP